MEESRICETCEHCSAGHCLEPGAAWRRAVSLGANAMTCEAWTSKREQGAKLRRERNARARLNRQLRDDVMKSCGLVKVRVNGKTFWE